MDFALQGVALSRLVISPNNPRKTPPSEQERAAMAASLASGGLIYPLILDPHDDGAEQIGVVAGGRRLVGFQDLAAEGRIPADHPIPCYTLPEGSDPTEIGLIENTIRAALHPADQFESFRQLAEKGTSLDTIAERFSVSRRTVEKRLLLARVAPELLEAYRADAMSLKALEAFTLSADHDQQHRVWEAAQQHGDWNDYRARFIHNALTQERLPATHPLARYATIKKYKAAGGRVSEDLFAENANDTYLDDVDIVMQVASERLEKHAARLRKQWGWVETSTESTDYRVLERYGRVEPQPTEEESARLVAIEDRLDEIYQADDLTPELNEETHTLRDEAIAIRRTVGERPLDDDARAKAGCLITIEHGGRARVHEGLVRPEDLPRINPAEGNGSPETPHMPRNARTASFYSDRHADLLRSVRTAVVQAKLARNFQVSFDIVLYEFARQLLPHRSPSASQRALSLTVKPVNPLPGVDRDEAYGEATALQAGIVGELEQALPVHCVENESTELDFRALASLDIEQKQAVFTYCVSRLAPHQLSFDARATAALEAAIEQLDIEPHAVFRPTASLFWSRMRKDQILVIADEVIGPSWVEKHRRDRKSDLAVFMEQVFRDPCADPDVPAEAHERILTWSIPGFRAFGPDPMEPGDETLTAEEGATFDAELSGDEAEDGAPGDEAGDIPAFLED
ncbi:MAG: ParB N-terminal domain-containing protein [Gammaproteobacteria bacterium]|nr:ParB N-terminal domain-containing protein [Gammaproteobacteria bacterium]